MKHLILCSLLAVASANAQVESIDEDFQDFPITSSGFGGPYGLLPHGGWSANKPYPYAFVGKHSSAPNKYLRAYSFMSPNDPIYFFSPQLVSTKGNLSFFTGSSGGHLEVGLVSSPSDVSDFQLVMQFELQDGLFKKQLDMPESDKKYIAFKYVPSGAHRVFGVDNVKFVTPASKLKFSMSEFDFYVNNVENKLVFTNNVPNTVKIFDMGGALLTNQEVTGGYVDINNLTSGVYVAVLEGDNGVVSKVKFVKK